MNLSPNSDSLPTMFMFSGQGSQYYQMGRDLYDNHLRFREHMNALDTMFHDYLGSSVLAQIYAAGPDGATPFDDIEFTHPAIFMVEYALAQVLLEQGIEPDCILGISLGELTGAAVAKVITLEDCVRFIYRQAKLFKQQCSAATMIAIIDSLSIYKSSELLERTSEISGINSRQHFVITLAEQHESMVNDYLKSNHILYQKIPVKQGFHSSLIEPVAADFQQLAAGIEFRKPVYPIFSAADVSFKRCYDQDHFWNVLRGPILFFRCIRYLEGFGGFNYLDLGPMGTMAALSRQVVDANSASKPWPVITQFSRDCKNLETLITHMTWR